MNYDCSVCCYSSTSEDNLDKHSRTHIMGNKPTSCLLCHWEPDKNSGSHIPQVIHESGVYVCKECVTRAKTVDSFGLTVDELKQAADFWKSRNNVNL